MKLVNIDTNQIFHCTMMENIDGNISIINKDRKHIATVPASQAKLIFNEEEIPYMEEVE
jgi:hypothetical protein